jgi:hypothetical protein
VFLITQSWLELGGAWNCNGSAVRDAREFWNTISCGEMDVGVRGTENEARSIHANER